MKKRNHGMSARRQKELGHLSPKPDLRTVIECHKCGHKERYFAWAYNNPEKVIKICDQLGWTFGKAPEPNGGNYEVWVAYCRDCSASR